ncbi:MAG: hypothetical protein ACTTJO_00240 [Metamycoplasmataceae bacterium]|uniref:hypothetical protein n=1 Tax=Mycoplasmopsis lipophila TaxID=2117 RepID=UPI00387345D2
MKQISKEEDFKKVYIAFWILAFIFSLLFLILWLTKVISYAYLLGFSLGYLISFLIFYLKDIFSIKILLKNNKSTSIAMIYLLFLVDVIVIAFISFYIFWINSKVSKNKIGIATSIFNVFCFLVGMTLYPISIFVARIKIKRKEVIIEHK